MIIDVHGNIPIPDELTAYLLGWVNGTGIATRGGPRPFPISDERMEQLLAPHLSALDEVGTDVQLVSAPPAAVPTAERRNAVVTNIVRQLNDLTAQAVRLHPDRFAGVGVLPQSPSLTPHDALAEMRRCTEDLGFVAFVLNPDPGEGGWEAPNLGDACWFPFYEELLELGTPGLIRGGAHRFSRESELGYACQEESVATWALLRSSAVWSTFPGLALVVGHGGGYVPYQYGRGRCFRLNEGQRAGAEPTEGFEETLRRLWFDTVLYEPAALELLFTVCGPDRCLFGSGRPGVGSTVNPVTGRELDDVLAHINGVDWLDDDQRRSIHEENARRLFSRLASV